MKLKTSLHFIIDIPDKFDRQGLHSLLKNFVKPFTLCHCHDVFPVSNSAWGKRQQREVRSRTCTSPKPAANSVSLGKQFLPSSAFPCHWPAEGGPVCSFEDVLPNLSAVNKTQHRPIILTPYKVIQLICSGVLLIYLRSKRKLLRATPLIFLSV